VERLVRVGAWMSERETTALIEKCEAISASLSMEPTAYQLEQAVEFLVAEIPAAVRELSRLANGTLTVQHGIDKALARRAVARAEAAEADRDRLQAKLTDESGYCGEVLIERDRYREALERLTDAIEAVQRANEAWENPAGTGMTVTERDYVMAEAKIAVLEARAALATPDTPPEP